MIKIFSQSFTFFLCVCNGSLSLCFLFAVPQNELYPVLVALWRGPGGEPVCGGQIPAEPGDGQRTGKSADLCEPIPNFKQSCVKDFMVLEIREISVKI